MAVPVWTNGSVSTGVTTGVPTVTPPSHVADDILVVWAQYWGPNTSGDVATIPVPTGFTQIGNQFSDPSASPRDGVQGLFWKRATSNAETITMTRGASWDTGTDTSFNAANVQIRGCKTTGNPYENLQETGPLTGSSTSVAIVSSGTDRLAAHFAAIHDDSTLLGANPTAQGWSSGTSGTSGAGTDSGFYSTWKAQTTAGSTNTYTTGSGTPAQGSIGIWSLCFIPPSTAARAVKVKAGGTFATKVVKVKASGTFATKTMKIKTGGVFV